MGIYAGPVPILANGHEAPIALMCDNCNEASPGDACYCIGCGLKFHPVPAANTTMRLLAPEQSVNAGRQFHEACESLYPALGELGLTIIRDARIDQMAEWLVQRLESKDGHF